MNLKAKACRDFVKEVKRIANFKENDAFDCQTLDGVLSELREALAKLEKEKK